MRKDEVQGIEAHNAASGEGIMSDGSAEPAETPPTVSGEYALRRMLSDELHARAFYDFDGAGRFVRFVFLTGDQDGAVLDLSLIHI